MTLTVQNGRVTFNGKCYSELSPSETMNVRGVLRSLGCLPKAPYLIDPNDPVFQNPLSQVKTDWFGNERKFI